VSRPATGHPTTFQERAARARSFWSRRDVLYALFFLNLLLIAAFWWSSSGFEITRNAASGWNGVGRITGLAGTYLVLWQLLLMARLPWLEHAFGFELTAAFHRWNGYLAIGLLLAHGIFQTIGYLLTPATPACSVPSWDWSSSSRWRRSR